MADTPKAAPVWGAPVPGATAAPAAPLRTDGPTLEEFVAAGYLAANYPPAGYAVSTTPSKPADGLKDTQEPAAKPPVDTAPPAAPESMTVRMWHAVKGYADVHVNEVENWVKHEWQKVVDKV